VDVLARTIRSFQVSDLPPQAKRYVTHAIDPGTPLPSAVRLKMHGEIKLGQGRPFRAEQVISRDGQFVWAATVSVEFQYVVPIVCFKAREQ